MTHVLITSGPTRQYLDPVRYLTNGSSGRMGRALAEAALGLGYEVTVVSGPVDVTYPLAAKVINVISTEEMLESCRKVFSTCDGLIGAAAPCDYRPQKVAPDKISKTGDPLRLELIETPDIVATLAVERQPHQWVVGFALETQDQRLRALAKLERKSCDLIVSNGADAMNALDNQVEVIDPLGQVLQTISGSKEVVAQGILGAIQRTLIEQRFRGMSSVVNVT